MSASVQLILPGGFWLNGSRHQEVVLRCPNGEDELFVAESRRTASVAWRVSAFLSRLVERLGSISEITPATMSWLTVGDREALLLQVRRIAFGDELHGVTRCPACRTLLDLDLKISDLLVSGSHDSLPEYEMNTDWNAASFHVAFRLPVGADQEGAASQPTVDAGAAWIMRQTVRRASCNGERIDNIPSPVVEELSARMAELDPQAEVVLQPQCVACGTRFSSFFDAAHYLFEELTARGQELLRDVHRLASQYHWSESSIFALPRMRRRSYIAFLEEEPLRRQTS